MTWRWRRGIVRSAMRCWSAIANAVEISSSARDDICVDANELAQVIRVDVFAASRRSFELHGVVTIIVRFVFVLVFII